MFLSSLCSLLFMPYQWMSERWYGVSSGSGIQCVFDEVAAKAATKILFGLAHRLFFHFPYKNYDIYWSREKSIWTWKTSSPSSSNYQYLVTVVILKFMTESLISGSTVGLFPLSVGSTVSCSWLLAFILFQKLYWKIICLNNLMPIIISFCREGLCFLLSVWWFLYLESL